MEAPGTAEENPYEGLRNVLELIMPQLVDHYLDHVVESDCACVQCRRDILACTLSSLRPVYYGSLTPAQLADPKIQLRTISIESIDQQLRRAIAFVGEAPHHARRTENGAPIETATPQELSKRIVERLMERPLLEQLYGVPVPMCLTCHEVGRLAESHFCDKCGQPLVQGLPSTSLRLR
jgi:hypothetical protein